MSRLSSRQYKIKIERSVFLIVLLDLLGWAVILPVLPFYAERWGASPSQVTFLFSAYALAQWISSPWLGKLSDRVGRKNVLIVSLLGTAFSFGLLWAAKNYYWILLSRVLDGLTAGNLSVAHAALTDITKNSERSATFGRLGLAYAVAFIFGPIITLLHGKGHEQGVFLSALFICFLSLVVLLFYYPSNHEKIEFNFQSTSDYQNLGRQFDFNQRSGINWKIVSLLLIHFFSYQLFTSGIGIFSEKNFGSIENPFDSIGLSILYLEVGVIGAFSQGVMYPFFLKKWGDAILIQCGFFSCAIGFLGLVFSKGWMEIGLLSALSICGLTFIKPTLYGLVSNQSSEDQQGWVMGWVQSLNSLSQVLAPALGGVLLSIGQGTIWMIFVSVLCTIGGILCSFYIKFRQPFV